METKKLNLELPKERKAGEGQQSQEVSLYAKLYQQAREEEDALHSKTQ